MSAPTTQNEEWRCSPSCQTFLLDLFVVSVTPRGSGFVPNNNITFPIGILYPYRGIRLSLTWFVNFTLFPFFLDAYDRSSGLCLLLPTLQPNHQRRLHKTDDERLRFHCNVLRKYIEFIYSSFIQNVDSSSYGYFTHCCDKLHSMD